MFRWFWILPLIFLLIIFIYNYCYIRKRLRLHFPNVSERKLNPGAAFASLLMIVPLFILDLRSWGTGWLIALFYFTLIAALLDLSVVLGKKLPGLRNLTIGGVVKKLYYNGGLPIILTVLLLAYGYWNFHNVVATSYTLAVNRPVPNDNYKIALLSDLHYGISANIEELTTHIEAVNAHNPDLVVLLGDIIDEGTPPEDIPAIFSLLGSINNKDGIFFVYGNHDLSLYSPQPAYTKAELENLLSSSGIRVLEDETYPIGEEILLLGRKDYSQNHRAEGRISISEWSRRIDKKRLVIVLDHQPHEFEEMEKAGFSIVLSGHTHGGQIWPLGLIMEAINFHDVHYGYAQIGNLHAVVSSGMAGWGFPIRTEKHSEFNIITLKQNKDFCHLPKT